MNLQNPNLKPLRWLLAAVCCKTAVAVAASAGERECAAPPPPRPKLPNILMIVSDDQAWTDFGFMGNRDVRTPRLDRLASESAFFPHGYAPMAICRPSLASLLTGMYPHQHGICFNDPPKGVARDATDPLMRNAPSLPRLLQPLGYRSLQTGKWWEGDYRNGGFTDGMKTEGKTARHGGKGPEIGRDTMQPLYDFIVENKNAGTPFFAWYAPRLPHKPHNPPQRLLEKYKAQPPGLAAYYAMCEWLDETCGQLLDFLDAQGLRDDTLVVFAVDNGWAQNPKKVGAPLPSKGTSYDLGTRTPLLFRWPGRVKPGKCDTPISTIDIAPTIRDAAGMPADPKLPGANLLPALEGKAKLAPRPVFGEACVAIAKSLENPAANITALWVRDGDWKLIRATGVASDLPIVQSKNAAPVELYNLAADPLEKKNLAAENPEIVRKLGALIDGWWKPGKN